VRDIEVTEGRVDYHIDLHRGRQRAVCTCGWSSDWTSSSGLAGGVWDEHVNDRHRKAG
jgi:hypothetical protein